MGIYNKRKKYNKDKYYIKFIWTATYHRNNKANVGIYEDEFEFDSFPREEELISRFRQQHRRIINNNNWSDIRIIEYTVLLPMSKSDIVIK